MALDKVPAAMMSGLLVSETAPSNPGVGQRWYRASTAVTYQYTNDGTSSFWLDVSSGGIGTSAERGVDYVGDIDPLANHNGGSATLAVGQVYYNRENNRHFVCTDATTNANVWSGRFTATGGTVTSISGYRVHTFLSSGTFIAQDDISIEYLVVAGGGAGGGHNASGGGGGGFKTATGLSVPIGTYAVTVGAGGAGQGNAIGLKGGDSTFHTITSTGGGYGGSGSGSGGATGGSGGSGGGASGTASPSGQGNAGGSGGPQGSGGGGAGAAGGSSAGGVGLTSSIDGTSYYYSGGGGASIYQAQAGNGGLGGGGGGGARPGGSAGAGSGGGSARNAGSNGEASTSNGVGGAGGANTGGGGGGTNGSGGTGGAGGSGIVIVRYAV